MEKITAWIFDPTKSIFKQSKNEKAALFEIFCKDKEKCDIYKQCNSCILTGGLGSCVYGRKTMTNGFSKRSIKFNSWIREKTEANKDYTGKLSSLTAFQRVFKIGEYLYLPYSFMTGTWNLDTYPLKSSWVKLEEVTPELLERICNARPQALMGGEIRDYQEKSVPKFLFDLKTFYPDIFDLVPDHHKLRIENINFIGRKADITTCNPGKYKFGNYMWNWDGEILSSNGESLLWPPAKGETNITIKPQLNSPVVITDNSQVGENTKFLD